MITRREAIKTTALAAAAIATAPGVLAQAPATPASSAFFSLPALPYAFDALEPHLDARTMEIHHDRHHKAYVDNLNKAVAEFPALGKENIETLTKNVGSAVPEKIRTAVRNNGGGHYNHALFWQMMAKSGGGTPKAELAKAIDAAFGSFTAFQEQFTKAALGRFGSGWSWLVLNQGKLEVVSTANQDSPLMGQAVAGCAGTPLLGLDVWEHAYYLKYQNKRADYITAWWNVVSWEFVTECYLKAKG